MFVRRVWRKGMVREATMRKIRCLKGRLNERNSVLSTNHPTNWLPAGRPFLACIEAMLERVTIMASTINPICVPTIVLENPSLALPVDPPRAGEARRLVSNRRYKIPTKAIRKPPSNLGTWCQS